MKGIEVRIMHNLKGRCYPVNSMTAVSGVDPFVDGLKALKVLVTNGTVKASRLHGMEMYLLGFEARLNNSTLTRVK